MRPRSHPNTQYAPVERMFLGTQFSDLADRDTVLLPVVQRLNAAEALPPLKALEVQLSQSLRQVENLESMRIHLHDCPGDPGAAEHSIDWAPLERLLSQGPVSHSLLHIICDSLKYCRSATPAVQTFA